ncbi:MAG TPA: PEP/pyruvate-binding domain-containing protein [Polyangia bacterium]|nr:PEP/pyruvate-binding domain-containing protein [Polyangia bacterium]
MRVRVSLWSLLLVAGAIAGSAACSSGSAGAPAIVEGTCQAPGGDAPDFLKTIGCRADFDGLASQPLDATIPGARSVKVVLDQLDGDALYFQNSVKYGIHYQFASTHLSGNGLPLVPSLSEFNLSQYYMPDRRFVLGAVTYYEGPRMWVLEVAPYDTASAAMITKLFTAVRKAAYFGPALAFHPTSEAVATEAKKLTAAVPISTTDQIYAKIDYQPLNLGSTVGKLVFVNADDLASAYLGYRDIVVIDTVPNDISVVAGMISQDFQTPLSHVNILAQNRKTPNMGLRGATTDPALRALAGKWVTLTVGASEYSVVEATPADADAYWEAHKPAAITLPVIDTSVTDLRDIGAVVVEGAVPLRDAIETAIKAFGAKAAGYSVLANTTGVPSRKAFAIPAFYYLQFMQQNGFFDRLDALQADAAFRDDAPTRDARLATLRADILAAPIDAGLQALLKAKLAADYPDTTMRFRSSTNAEDLDGFPCAGCYDSHTGDPKLWDDSLLMAIKKTWATVWNFRTFEERAFHGIDHKTVGMALLVHHNFPSEEANGVALTANPFDPSGLEPGFYVNVQWGGDAEVVHPPAGVYSDEFVYEFSFPGQPIIYLSHSNLVDSGTTVLSPAQVFELGTALDAIHKRFQPAYAPKDGGWYAMDVEFKFDGDPGEVPHLYVKQARPSPGRGQ